MKTVAEKEKRALGVLAAIFAILAAGMIIVGYVAYQNYERQYRAQVESQLAAIAELKVSELVQWRAERLGDANFIYGNVSFTRLVARFWQDPANTDAQLELQAWLDKYQAYGQYDQVRLLDPQGVTRLSAPAGAPPVSTVVASHIPTVLQSGKVTLVDFYQNDRDQRVYLTTLVPILGDPGESAGNRVTEVIGILALRIDPALYLYPYIQQWPAPSQSAETLLLRRDGNDVLYLNDLRYRSNAALALRLSLAQTEVPAVRAALGQTGIMQGMDYRNVPVFADVRAVPDSSWFLVAKMDTAEVFAPLTVRLGEMILFVSVLLLGAGAGVGLIWRQQRVGFYRERFEAAEALRQSEGQFRTVLETVSLVGVVLDRAGLITLCNDFLLGLTGWQRDEVLNKNWFDIFLPPEIRNDVQAGIFRKSIASGEISAHFENEIVTRAGERRLIDWNNIVLRDPAGAVVGIASIGEDITERKRTEVALRESERLLRESQAIAGLGSYVLDVRTGMWTSSAILDIIFGIDEKYTHSIEGWSSLVHPEWQERMNAYFAHEILGKRSRFDKEYKIVRHSDEETRWVHGLGELEFDKQNQPIKMIGIIMDITERKQAEEKIENLNTELEQRVVERTAQLQAANQELEAFAYTVAHDLRSPLRAIDGFSRIIVEEYADKLDAEGNRVLNIVRNNAQKMDQLILGLLTLSRVTRGEAQFTRVDMTALAQTTFHEIVSPEAQATFAFSVAPLPDAFGDPTLLRQVWSNLISNAIKYTMPKTERRIEITCRTENGLNVYGVRDNGVGFNPAYKTKLFGVFQRLHKVQEFEGTGVGLAIVERIVKRHGGTVWGEAEINQGATFYFALPQLAQQEVAHEQSS